MQIAQLRYFVLVVQLGSLGKAARELNLATSTLSQQISRLESELSTRLLQRKQTGVTPTGAGIAFYQHAQLALRNIDEAAKAAKHARLSGFVSVGIAPTTASVIAIPLIKAMKERYPEVRFHLVESLSGHLESMLNARQLDLAILFSNESSHKWTTSHLLEESLYLIAGKDYAGFPAGDTVKLSEISEIPLAMPTSMHGLRNVLTSAIDRQALGHRVVLEIDSLAVLMEAVRANLAATIQPGAAINRIGRENIKLAKISDKWLVRRNYLVSLPDDQLSPAALATRVVIKDVVHELLKGSCWLGAVNLHN